MTTSQLARHATEAAPDTVPMPLLRQPATARGRAVEVAGFVGGVLGMVCALLLGAWLGLQVSLQLLDFYYFVASSV